MKAIGKKGQGSFLSGDIPSIILVVISIAFFLSAIYLVNQQFNSKKAGLKMEAASVEAASVFLKENAKIKPEDLNPNSEFWKLKLAKIEQTYGVQVYVELQALDPNAPSCTSPASCFAGQRPAGNIDQISKRFPIAMKGSNTDLDVYPALIMVSTYIS